MNPPSEQLVRDYLNDVAVAARMTLGPAERRALLLGTRESIDRAIGMSAVAAPEKVSRVLAALGDPAALVARYQANPAAAPTRAPNGVPAPRPAQVPAPAQGSPSGQAPPPAQGSPSGQALPPAQGGAGTAAPAGAAGSGTAQLSAAGRGPERRTAYFTVAARGSGLSRVASAAAATAREHPLEAGAVVLLGLGGLIFPPVWLFGVMLALGSKAWDLRDKWAGLAGPVVMVIIGTWVLVTVGSHHATVGAYAMDAWLVGGRLCRIAALLGAAYLAWRLGAGRREPAPPWSRSRVR
ncbi:MAG: hypothetical protein ACLQDY_04280 [Streptosporangiaceae bacterium]